MKFQHHTITACILLVSPLDLIAHSYNLHTSNTSPLLSLSLSLIQPFITVTTELALLSGPLNQCPDHCFYSFPGFLLHQPLSRFPSDTTSYHRHEPIPHKSFVDCRCGNSNLSLSPPRSLQVKNGTLSFAESGELFFLFLFCLCCNSVHCQC